MARLMDESSVVPMAFKLLLAADENGRSACCADASDSKGGRASGKRKERSLLRLRYRVIVSLGFHWLYGLCFPSFIFSVPVTRTYVNLWTPHDQGETEVLVCVNVGLIHNVHLVNWLGPAKRMYRAQVCWVEDGV